WTTSPNRSIPTGCRSKTPRDHFLHVSSTDPAMANRDTSVADFAAELGIKPVTLYRYVGPNGELREHGQQVLAAKNVPSGAKA
ncbi:hypothetical protein VQ044_24385, partial [Aurantimonas sp. C2-5-R2]